MNHHSNPLPPGTSGREKPAGELRHSRHAAACQEALDEHGPREAYLNALFQHYPFTTVIVDRECRIREYNQAKQQSGDRLPRKGDVMYRDYAAKHSADMHAELLSCIASGKSKNFPAMDYGNKILSITIAPFPDGAIIVTQDVTEVKRAERDRMMLIDDLRRALHEVETLRELLPICACCKRIRDDKGYWKNIEEYFQKRTNLDFSHTLCPQCAQRVYPEIWESLHPRHAKASAE